MTPDRLQKIRAIANDLRGDPATREIARQTLERLDRPWKDPRHPGMKTSLEYDRFKFMDLNNWLRTTKGNFVYFLPRVCRVTLFKHKRTEEWSWSRSSIGDSPINSGRFNTLAKAHENAWKTLMEI